MASISFSLVVSIFFAGYLTRNRGGIPIPVNEICDQNNTCWKKIDLWKHIVRDGMPTNPTSLLVKNLFVWFFIYSFAHVITHVEPQRRLFKPFKFNPNYPSLSLVAKEMLRSARGVFIATVYEIFVNQQHAKNSLPILDLPEMFQLSPPLDGKASELNMTGFFIILIILYAWGDFHFYWTHRMLHTKWLYKNVHKVHHESYNPDPFSGSVK